VTDAYVRIRRLEQKLARKEDNIRAINNARMELENARMELERGAIKTSEMLQAVRAENTLLNVKNARLDQQVKHLEEEVRKERSRVTQALDIAEESSIAAGSIGRLANGLGVTLQALETTITNINRDRRR
jgi:septal ring factor EnvC (AmiA/AmiB activator)